MIYSYASLGYDGAVVSVEADLRRSIPGFDVVGLPDSAVREARERVRVSIRNCGFDFPAARVLVNLSPADVRKEGGGFDLPIALAVILASSTYRTGQDLPPEKVLVLGELTLTGRVRKVKAVISAVSAALNAGITRFILPADNYHEAAAAADGNGLICPVEDLSRAVEAVTLIRHGRIPATTIPPKNPDSPEISCYEDFADIRGHRRVKRALEIAAAGRHNMLLFGPPGSGKTMAAVRFPGILPDLTGGEATEVTRLFSLAGKPIPGGGLITRPPFRAPHHSASQEGIIGGGKNLCPGEVSLSHKGVLFLDEAPEFQKSIIQALREPAEQFKVSVVRAGISYWFPADFQLIFTANPCPCGNLGSETKVCLCSRKEIEGYWKRLGAAVMDRIDMRIPLKPVNPEEIIDTSSLGSAEIRCSVEAAVEIQRKRYEGLSFDRNSRIPPGLIGRFCMLGEQTSEVFIRASKHLGLSSRACHSVLRVARTIADLDISRTIEKVHLLEASEHRRYGDNDFFWC